MSILPSMRSRRGSVLAVWSALSACPGLAPHQSQRQTLQICYCKSVVALHGFSTKCHPKCLLAWRLQAPQDCPLTLSVVSTHRFQPSVTTPQPYLCACEFCCHLRCPLPRWDGIVQQTCSKPHTPPAVMLHASRANNAHI